MPEQSLCTDDVTAAASPDQQRHHQLPGAQQWAANNHLLRATGILQVDVADRLTPAKITNCVELDRLQKRATSN